MLIDLVVQINFQENIQACFQTNLSACSVEKIDLHKLLFKF